MLLCSPALPCSTEPAVARTYLRKWCGDVGPGKRATPAIALLPACAPHPPDTGKLHH
jgi:hypothetical protein